MWAEARKHEKKIRGMMVDHRKRAERRREFYEKIKADPTQFLQIHGRRGKIHLDPAIAAAADSPATMMPWQGKADCLIDRFDGRAHLDIIREYKPDAGDVDPDTLAWEERQANYERYRIVVQNDFLGIQEEKFLHQIYLEEHFGISYNKVEEEKKKALAPKKAAIGYNYDERGASQLDAGADEKIEQEAEEEDIEDIDLDLAIAVDALSTEQMHNLNLSGQKFGMGHQDFMSLLSNDLSEQEEMRLARVEAEEKIAMQGKRTRRERRMLKDLKLATRNTSPPSYAARSSPVYGSYKSGNGNHESPHSSRYGKTEVPTGIGDDSDAEGKAAEARAFVEAIPLVESPKRGKSRSSPSRSPSLSPRPRPSAVRRSPSSRRSRSRSRSPKRQRSPDRSRKRYSSSRSRSRSRRRRSRSRSRRRGRTSRSRERKKESRSRSRSRSREPDSKRPARASRRYSSSRSPSPPARKTRSRSRDRRTKSRSRDRKSRSRERRTRRSPTPKKSPSKAGGQRKSSTPSSAPVKRYYGRRKEDHSSNEENFSDGESTRAASTYSTPSGARKKLPGLDRGSTSKAGVTSSKDSGGPKLTPAEKLKKKMQAALNKQYKADKRAENERKAKVEEERMYREEELKAVASEMRRRNRDKYGDGSRSESSRSRSRSRSPSRSRSRSPPRLNLAEYDASIPPPPPGRRGGYGGFRPRRPY